MLHARLDFSPDVIEAQFAHSVLDSLGRAHKRTESVDQRQTMKRILRSANQAGCQPCAERQRSSDVDVRRLPVLASSLMSKLRG